MYITMAIAPDKSDNLVDLLKCTICLEKYKVPKYLPCLHTFCELCLQTYISSTVDKEKNENKFKCPLYRQCTAMGESSGDIEKWAEKLPGNHFITSVMDRQAIKSSEKLCDSCQSFDKTETAVSWCTDCEEAFCRSCEKYHRAFKMTSRHTIVSLEDIISSKTNLKLYSTITCEEHTEEVIKAYCVDHSKPLCTLCATFSHRKCDDVISIDKAAIGIKESNQAKNLFGYLKETSSQIGKLLDNRKENLTQFKNEIETISIKINNIREKVLDHLKLIEDKIKDELTQSKKEIIIKLTEDSTTLSSFLSTINNWYTVLDTCRIHGTEQQFLLEMNKIYTNQIHFDAEIYKNTREMKTYSMSLESNLTEDLSSKMASLGIMKTKESRINSDLLPIKLPVNFQTGKIEVLQTIELGCKSSWTSGFFLRDNIIISTHQLSKVFKYSDDGRLETDLTLPNQPYDITQISETNAAVACYNTSDIITINTDNMTICQTIKLQGVKLKGLCHVDGEFIVAYNASLTWINAISGATMQTKATKGSTYHVFARTRNSYIFPEGQNSFSRVIEGNTTFTYTSDKLDYPRGVDMDCEGNIYICGYYSNNIHQLTSEGRLVRIISAESLGIQKVWTMRFSNNSSRFLVACHSTGKVVLCNID